MKNEDSKRYSAEELLARAWRQCAGPPTLPSPSDDLVTLGEEFVALKQRFGEKYHHHRLELSRFCRFLRGRGISKIQELTPQALVRYLEQSPGISNRTWNARFGVIKVFLDPLKDQGKIQKNPCTLIGYRRVLPWLPDVFSHEEIRKILDRSIPEPSWSAAPELYWTCFYVLYATGMRGSEICNLRLGDNDARERTLFIGATKFRRDRLIPIHPATQEILDRYRTELRPPTSSDNFFVYPDPARGAVRRTDLNKRFRLRLGSLGIYRKSRTEGGIVHCSPRLHGLRHAFAVHRLLKGYRDGADVESKLPLLTTYRGHADIQDTEVYLTITGLIMAQAKERFASRVERDLPLKP